MSTLRRLIALVCAISLPTSASAQEAVIVARASGPQLDNELVETVARTFKAKPLSGPLLGAAPGLTTGEVIARLCGSVSPAYYAEFERQNGGTSRPKSAVLTTTDAQSLVWPACLRVTSIALHASSDQSSGAVEPAYEALFGTTKQTVGSNNVNILAFLKKQGAFVASPVELTLARGVSKEDAIKALRDKGVAVASDAVTELRGHIVEAPDPLSVDPNNEAVRACPTYASPFDSVAVREAYEWSVKRRTALSVSAGVANIYVVDNGFFGANQFVADPYAESFPRRLFGGWTAEAGKVGPPTLFGADTIYPSNFTDEASVAITPDIVAAHGTHVAGLTLGGPDFRASRDALLFQTPGVDHLRLTVINLGRGQQFLLKNSQEYLRELLEKAPAAATAPPAKIVNLSVAYDGPQALGVFNGIFAQSPGTLFVVAAGNKSTNVSAGQIFPAGLGGWVRDNVMTVAAHDIREPAELSWFSNYGDNAVDVAAPGCGVKSWLNMVATGEVSGTSQATPIAVFETAMLKTLDGALTPLQLKGRAMASGDLLGGGAQRWNVVSGSKLNIPEALLLFDDLMEVLPPPETRQPGDKAEIWIGEVTDLWAFRCTNDAETYATGRPMRTLWGLKAQGAETFLFTNRDVGRLYHCAAAVTSPAEGFPPPFVRFVRHARLIDSKIVEDTTPQAPQDIGLDQLQKLVLKGPYSGYP